MPSADTRGWPDYARALGITAICTAVAYPLSTHVASVNVVMIYLLGTTFAGLRLARLPAAMTACANVLAFDFFFVPPRFSFSVQDAQYIFTLGVMLIVALVIANLMVGIRHHTEISDARAQRTSVLYALSRELAVAAAVADIIAVAVRHVEQVFGARALVLPAGDDGRLVFSPGTVPAFDADVARHVAAQGMPADADGVYLPLHGSRRNIGVIVVRPTAANGVFTGDKRRLLDAFAVQLALSLERAQLAEAAEAARFAAERAALRNTLLTSISHDLRTPLAAIAGAGSLIAQPEYKLNADRRATLGGLIERKARDMSQLLTNVLELMRLEFATGTIRADWHAIEDLVSLAMRNNEVRLAAHRVELHLPADSPVIFVDETLIVQILGNLLENAAKYTPPGTTVTISAAVSSGECPPDAAPPDDSVTLIVADDGPGFPTAEPELLFQKFQRGRSEGNVAGVGLGLAICRAAARLHGGDIHACENPGGGARFELRLPVKSSVDAPPAAEGELDSESDRVVPARAAASLRADAVPLRVTGT